MADVYEINRIDELGGYRSTWRALFEKTKGASFFQTLEWLEAYWQYFGQDQKLRALIVTSAGRPIGILPLVVRTEKTRVGSVRVLTYPLDDWGSTYGPIGGDPAAVLTAGLEHVRRTRRDWDLLELRWVDATGTDGGQTEEAMQSAGLQAYKTLWRRKGVVDLAGRWEDYLAGRTSKWRNNFRRSQRKLEERGRVTHLRYRPQGEAAGDGDPRWDLYDACLSVARESWQGSSQTGTTLSHESIRPFLRDAHAAAARTGHLDLNLLLVEGQPVAFAYNYHHAGAVFGLRAGYAAQKCSDGAGNLLLAYTIRDGYSRGDHTYDMGVGYLEGKRRLITRVVPVFRYSHFRLAVPKAQLLRLRRWMQQRGWTREAEAMATGV